MALRFPQVELDSEVTAGVEVRALKVRDAAAGNAAAVTPPYTVEEILQDKQSDDTFNRSHLISHPSR